MTTRRNVRTWATGTWAFVLCLVIATITLPVEPSPAVLATGGGPDGGPLLEASPPASPQFDSLKEGGWTGNPSDVVGVGTIDQHEYIIADYPYDDRGAEVALTPDLADHADRSVYSGPELPFAGKKAPQGASGDYIYPAGQLIGSADIVEVRVAEDVDSWYLLICLNALDDPARTGLAITIDDQNLTVGGLSAEFEGTPVELRADDSSNVFEIRIPRTVFDPGMETHRIFVGSGLWDVQTGTWLQPTGQSTIPLPLFDVAYISDEIFGQTTNSYERSYWNELKQSTYITQGFFPTGAFTVNFAQLSIPQCTSECVMVEPYDGLSIRIMKSSQTIDEGVRPDDRYGDSKDTGYRIYGSVFQPYAVYAPTDFANPHPLVILLHPEGGNYMSYFLTGWPSMRAWADELDAIVVVPFGRGEAGRFSAESEKDIFEVWRDVAQHYTVDRERVYLMGLGAGGEAAIRIANLYPDQFARVIAWGASFASLKDSVTCGDQGDGCPQTGMDLFGNTVSLPVLLSYGGLDVAAPPPSPNLWLKRLDGKDVPYRFVTYGTRAGNASQVGTDKSLILGWLAGRPSRARSPSHVNYTIIRKYLQGGTDGPNALYWLHDIRLASTADEGHIDAALTTDPLESTRIGPEVGLDGVDVYIAQSRTVSDSQKTENMLVIDVSNVAYLGVSTQRIGWDTGRVGSLRGLSNRECDLLLEGVYLANAHAEGVPFELRSNGMLLHLPPGEFSAEIIPALD